MKTAPSDDSSMWTLVDGPAEEVPTIFYDDFIWPEAMGFPCADFANLTDTSIFDAANQTVVFADETLAVCYQSRVWTCSDNSDFNGVP